MAGILVLICALAIPVSLIALLVWMVKRRKKREAFLTSQGVRLLPVWSTVGKAYKLAWRYKMEYLRISWCWLALSVLAMFLLNFLFAPSTCVDGQAINMADYQPSFKDYLFSELSGIVELFFGVSIAVAWHRLILRNERVATNVYLRFDRVVWDYCVIGLLILFITGLPGLVTFIGGVDVQPSGPMVIKTILAGIFSIVSYFYATRLSVILPAKALDVPGITIKEVLLRTRSNNWRLCWGPVLCGLIFIPIFAIITIPIGMEMSAHLLTETCLQSSYTSIVNTVAPLIVLLIGAPVYLSFLSLAYQFFFEHSESSTTA